MNDTEKKLQADFAEKVAAIPGAVITEPAEYQTKMLSLRGKIGWLLSLPVEGRYCIGKQMRRYSINVTFNYCPFCGEKYLEN